MELNNRTSLLLIALVLLTGLMYSFIVPVTHNYDHQFQNLADFLYQSPVLKSYRPYFSLADKKIIDLTGKDKKNDTPAVILKPIASPTLKPSPTANPSATPFPTLKPTADAKTDSVNPTKGLTIRFDPHFNDKKIKENNEISIGAGASGPITIVNTPTDQDISEWKYKLSQNPSKENMNLFVKAYTQEKVVKSVFYAVLNALLDENNEAVQRIALYGLAATPSIESYNILAAKSNDVFLKPSNLSFDHKILEYYSQPSMIAVLANALRNSNEVVVLEALHNVSETLKNPTSLVNATPASNQNTSSGSRFRRENVSRSQNSSSIKSLISSLQNLAQSHNPQIAYNSEMLIQRLGRIIITSPQPSIPSNPSSPSNQAQINY